MGKLCAILEKVFLAIWLVLWYNNSVEIVYLPNTTEGLNKSY